MDADRVRSYLQVACAGLGFDIGEVWWMSNDSGTSTVAAIGELYQCLFMLCGVCKMMHLLLFFPLTLHTNPTSLLFILPYRTTLMSIEDNRSNGDSSNNNNGTTNNTSAKPRKRFLQLYTSKAYCNQRSKLVQPHDTDDKDDNDEDSKMSPSSQLAVRNSQTSNPSDEAEHVLSPRIVEAVTHTTQVVWANANSTSTSLSSTNNNEDDSKNNNGLLGRSDIKLQTAIGMPVGVDQSGNVWVVVMFSPNNVSSTSDAIDYLQYISKSAGSSSIPCLLPVIGNPPRPQMGGSGEGGGKGDRKMICNGKSSEDNNNNNINNNQQLSLVSIKPKSNIPKSHTQNLGDGVTTKFVSFTINDDDEFDGPTAGEEGKVSQLNGTNSNGRRVAGEERDIDPSLLRNAMKDDWGIPILPDTNSSTTYLSSNNHQQQQQSQLDAIDSAITDAFDEASYGVWSTIMNSPAANGSSNEKQQQQITTTSTNEISITASNNESQIMANNKKMNVIQERLEEFATAFLGMSVFDVADAWVVQSSSSSITNEINGESLTNNNEASKMGRELKCLFTVAATNTNPNINTLRHVSSSTTINIGNGAVGKAYSSGYPVWSSVKELIYDTHRQVTLNNCKIETAFAIPIFSSTTNVNNIDTVIPSCILSCYSLLPAESVPFVINFVQKAVRLLWSGLDNESITPHESVGKELWTNVNPSDLGEMAADLEMQKEFIGKKRPRGLSFQDVDREKNEQAEPAEIGQVLPSLAPSPLPIEQSMDLPTIDAPPPVPGKGLAPAPLFPNTVQDRSPNAQEFVLLHSGGGNVNGGHWAVQQAVQSVAQLWDNANNAMMGSTTGGNNINQQLPPPQYQQEQLQQSQSQQYEMAYVNYDTTNSATVAAQLVQEQITDPMVQQHQQQQQAIHQNPIPMPPPQTTAAYPPHGVHADDPATIQANLLEFNAMAAMAQMNNNANNINQHVGAPLAAAPQMAAAMNPSMNGSAQMNQQLPVTVGTNHNMNVDEMISAMIAESEGPSVVTGLQQCYPATAPSTQQAHSKSTTGSKPCRIEGCTDTSLPRRPYCAKHCGTRLCEKEGCTKCAQGATRFCISHGGGRRCTFPGCDKGARDKYFCAAHGGGKRCKNPGCNKSAVGGSNFCTGHGGGRRCQVPGCDKSAQSSTKFCVKHGGGKKCQHPGCTKVSRGRTLYCAAVRIFLSILCLIFECVCWYIISYHTYPIKFSTEVVSGVN